MTIKVYPTGIDSFTTWVDDVDVIVAAAVNDVEDQIVVIETELGTNPKGSMTDLKTRLAVSINDDGTLKTSASGYSGYSGYSGSGTSGYSGYSGSGTSGYSGYSGSGTSGYSGYSGSGTSGYSGYSGSGTSGYSGYSGSGTSGYSGYSGAVTYSRSFVLSYPTASADSALWRCPSNSTITAVHVLCIGGTNIVGSLWQFDANGSNGAASHSDITATAQTNANDAGISTPAITANNYIGWKTTSVSGSPTRAIITFEYTVP